MKLKHRFALVGTESKEILTHQGRVILHDNQRELEWLFAKGIELGSLRVTTVSARFVSERPTIRLRNHPDMSAVRFPLDPDEFRDGRS